MGWRSKNKKSINLKKENEDYLCDLETEDTSITTLKAQTHKKMGKFDYSLSISVQQVIW